MGMLINIDNGGTLTDICVLKDNNFYTTKTLTTPYDLSKCFFDGLKDVSKAVYGQEDVTRLLAEVEHIRYSTIYFSCWRPYRRDRFSRFG